MVVERERYVRVEGGDRFCFPLVCRIGALKEKGSALSRRKEKRRSRRRRLAKEEEAAKEGKEEKHCSRLQLSRLTVVSDDG